MNVSDSWSVQLTVSETEGQTDAKARLVMGEGQHITGHGRARLNPTDQEVERIGAEIALARALSDLAHELLHVAARDVEGMTQAPAHLHM